MFFAILLARVQHRLFTASLTFELLFPIAILAILDDVRTPTGGAFIGDDFSDHTLSLCQLCFYHYLGGLGIDKNRRIHPPDVARAIDEDIANGITPIAVVATAGTTLTGTIDPIEELAEICKARNIWLHVDSAYGLPAASLPNFKKQFAGLAYADSVTIDAHKWLYLPKACGVVLVRNKKTLAAAFSHNENYMLHDESDMNPVDRTLENSRPFRALKLWLAFRVHGADQFRTAIGNNLAQAKLCRDLIMKREELELLVEPQLSTVPFRHVPKHLQGNETALNDHNLKLVKAMQDDGRVYVSSAVVDGKVCLRPCFVNFRTCTDDVNVLIEVTLELGKRVTTDK
ncbi:MAG: pyridoxal phosphate-dependent decarboxylase family protein [Trueperaceae bacterium]